MLPISSLTRRGLTTDQVYVSTIPYHLPLLRIFNWNDDVNRMKRKNAKKFKDQWSPLTLLPFLPLLGGGGRRAVCGWNDVSWSAKGGDFEFHELIERLQISCEFDLREVTLIKAKCKKTVKGFFNEKILRFTDTPKEEDYLYVNHKLLPKRKIPCQRLPPPYLCSS